MGRRDWSPAINDFTQKDGWVQPLVRKVLGAETSFKSKLIREITTLPNPRLDKLKGHGKKAAWARFEAKSEGCDLVIFIVDADTNDDGERESRSTAITAGFEAIPNGVNAVSCVPQSTSESWLLSDIDAWKSLGLVDGDKLPKKSPELLWGTVNDPAGFHPKVVFEQACNSAGVTSNREVRATLSEASSLVSYRERCPKSCAPFLDELEATKG